jgi:hypothetical protein
MTSDETSIPEASSKIVAESEPADPRPFSSAAVPALVFGFVPIPLTLVVIQLGLFVPYPVLQFVSYGLVAASLTLAFFYGYRGRGETRDGAVRGRRLVLTGLALAYVNGSLFAVSFGLFLFTLH